MPEKNAPVLLFVYKRLDLLIQTVPALQANFGAADTELFIFSDGPKNERDEKQVARVREYLKTISGFKNVVITESPVNKGLANSIINGVSRVIQEYGKVIVIEDDLITTPNFISYMNACLEKYQSAPEVFSIVGYSFNLGAPVDYQADGYFLYRGWPWGWATWYDRWKDIDWDVKDYSSFIKNKKARRKFARGGSDVNAMLQQQMEGRMDSWAIRWIYHQFKVNGLTFYPVFSKVYNNGFGEQATHTIGSNRRYIPRLDTMLSETVRFPEQIEVNPYFQKSFLRKMGILSRIRSRTESMFLSIRRKFK